MYLSSLTNKECRMCQKLKGLDLVTSYTATSASATECRQPAFLQSALVSLKLHCLTHQILHTHTFSLV